MAEFYPIGVPYEKEVAYTEHNIYFLLGSLAFLLVIVYYFVKQKLMKMENNRLFFWLVLTGFLDVCCGILCTVLIMQNCSRLDWWIKITATCLMLLDIAEGPALLLYLRTKVVPASGDRKWLNVVMAVLSIGMGLAVLANPFTGSLFQVKNGSYRVGERYYLMYLYYGAILAVIAVLGVRHREDLGRKKLHSIWELLLITALSIFYRWCYSRFHTEFLSGFTITLGITVLFLTLNNPYLCTDSQTGAFNQRFFRDRCKEWIRHKKPFHVLAVHLNQLKHVNFVMGTEIGNMELAAVTRMLNGCSRKNLVFRISGKRFLVMCPTTENLVEVQQKAAEFFSSTLTLKGETLEPHAVLCSIRHAEELGSSDDLISYVEYLAGQTKWPFETSLVSSSSQLLQGFRYYQEVESFLDTAMQEDLFEVAFQPVYSLENNCYTTMEVLSRLNHPKLGPVSPAVFIEIAEKNDQIARIALLQLERVCKFLSCNPQIQQSFQNVKINVSPVELLKPGHVDRMLDIIRKHELPLDFFQFEITESTAIEHGEMLDQIVEQFSAAGIGLCLDDFGSGYANLNAVMKLPFHTIKLDRSLLFGICQDSKVASLYQSLVVSLHNMGFHVLSEGVETDQELDLVKQWGVDMIQGFYFSRPLAGHVLMKNLIEPTQP